MAGVCDICGAPGMGTLVSAEQMREAVFGRGFNPFQLGMITNPMLLMVGTQAAYDHWRNVIVAQDTSDWNVCSKCMARLKPYLKDVPKATGVRKSTVSFRPDVRAAAGAAAERKYSVITDPAAPGSGAAQAAKQGYELVTDHTTAHVRAPAPGARAKPAKERGLSPSAAGRSKRRRIWIAVGGVTLFLCFLCVGLSMWSSQLQERTTESTAAIVSPTHVRSALPTSTPSPIHAPTTSATSTLSPTDMPTRHATTALLPTPTRTPPPTSTPLPDAVVNVDALNLRAGPGTHYDRVGLLGRGDTPQVLARTAAGDWLAVKTASGAEGWVFAAYVDLNLSPESVPVVSEIPPTPTPAGPTPTPLPPVDAEIERIAQGNHGELGQPSEVGGIAADGEAEVTIVNDTPYELTILVGDPSSVSTTVEACATCKVYSFVGPVFCPEEGRSQTVVRLKPGTSKVAAKVSDPSVIPFLGTWELKADTRYLNCFYIVTRFQ